MPNVNLVNWLIALSPIIVVLILMVGLRWGGSKAGPVGWLVALVVEHVKSAKGDSTALRLKTGSS